MTPYIDAGIIAIIGLFAIAAWKFFSRSLKRELTSVIEDVVNPELERIHRRIDKHMEREEEELKNLIRALSELSSRNEEEWRSRITD